MAPALSIDTLFRTSLPASDPNFLSSCTGRSDPSLAGLAIPDDDPTQPYRYFYSKAAAALPPGQIIPVIIYVGSDIMSTVDLTAAQLALPNLPGEENFPPYVVPFTNAMWTQTPGFPPNTFPSSWLSQEADVAALAALFPGASVQSGQACFPLATFNLGNAPAGWQPWVLVLPGGVKTFAGGPIQQMYGPNSVNGGGRGNPGAWVNNAWVPTPPPAGQSASTLGMPCLPVPAGYQLQRVENGITFIWELVPTGGTAATASIVINGVSYTITVTPQ